MRKNILVVLLSMTLMTIIPLLGLNDVKAQDFESCQSYFWQGNTKVPGPFKISILKDNGTWPIPVVGGCDFDGVAATAPEECHNYRYQVTENDIPSTGINQVLNLVPYGVSTCIHSNCNESNVNQISALGFGFSDVGDYGYLIDHEYAIRVPPDSSTGGLNIFLSSNSVGLTSFAFKVGRLSYGCGPIKGVAPAPIGFAQGAVTTSSVVSTEDGNTWCLTADPATQCDVVVDCDTGEIAESIPITEFNFGTTGATSQVVFSASPGQPCPKFYIKNRGANTDYMCIAGRCYPCPPYRCLP